MPSTRCSRDAHFRIQTDLGSTLASAPRAVRQDCFIIKPRYAGFYATNLQILLPKLGVRRLVSTGIPTDAGALFTAADAHMRDRALWVREEAVG